MTLEQLRIFVVVAEHEHVTRASYALDMVQSAVSKAVATLEDELSLALFDRVGRNIRLTPRGAEFRDKAMELLDHAAVVRAWTREVGSRVEKEAIVRTPTLEPARSGLEPTLAGPTRADAPTFHKDHQTDHGAR